MMTKVLIVDDEETMREVIKDIISESGQFTDVTLYTASNGLEGLEQFRAHKPEIIITDVMMPKMDGRDLVKTIRQENANIEFIVVTGFADVELASGMIKDGIGGLLKKPFQPDELILLLGKIIKKRELQSKNSEMKKRLFDAEKLSSIGLLAAGIAHEINNPNTFVKGNLELLLKYLEILHPHLQELKQKNNGQDPKLDRVIDSIGDTINMTIDGSQRIAKIVSGLLSFSRNPSVKRSSTNCAELIEQALTLIGHKTKMHKLELDMPAELANISVNKHDLVQTFMNLMVNACDAIVEAQENGTLDRGDGMIKVKIYDDHDHGEQILMIADNGCGIPEQNFDKIFDPFFTTKEVGKGTGLGMSISKGNIQNSGGQMSFESKVGKGTVFTIRFPLAQHEQKVDNEAASQQATV
ncbi:MAG: response regulator [Deltaproteobacteria bacterium]|nr:response regulator [Deltaproteobacteria bacterium]